MNDLTRHWAERLKKGDKVKATIRHETDGSKNLINTDCIVENNDFPENESLLLVSEVNNEYHIIPYNEIKE